MTGKIVQITAGISERVLYSNWSWCKVTVRTEDKTPNEYLDHQVFLPTTEARSLGLQVGDDVDVEITVARRQHATQ